jgi:hypothetical protein
VLKSDHYCVSVINLVDLLKNCNLEKVELKQLLNGTYVKLSTHFCSFETMPDKAKCNRYLSLKQYCFGIVSAKIWF